MANTFSNRAVKGLIKFGNIYCPKNGEFPSYEEVAGTQKLDNLALNVPNDDFSALNLVLIIFSFLPNGMVKWFADKFEAAQNNPSDNIIQSNFRLLNLGLRGLCYSTYYSEFNNPNYNGKKPLEVIDYHLNRVEI